MDVTLLGTGSSDGWPNAFCRCPSCTDQRALGWRRSPTCALVDGRLLLDLGPGVEERGNDLAEVTTVLVTHAHPDHFHPAALMYRSWVTEAPLHVLGPAPVTEQATQWLDPDQQLVTFTTLHPGDIVNADGYRITALPATHSALGQALLYVIERDGHRLAYCTDTGLLGAEALALLAGVRLDLLLLEETFGDLADPAKAQHLHLGTFADTLATLRNQGTLDDRSDVVAIHLSHYNPPLAELDERLATIGARTVADGTNLTVPRP